MFQFTEFPALAVWGKGEGRETKRDRLQEDVLKQDLYFYFLLQHCACPVQSQIGQRSSRVGFTKTLQSGRLPHTGEPEHASGWPCAAPGGVGRGRGL